MVSVLIPGYLIVVMAEESARSKCCRPSSPAAFLLPGCSTTCRIIFAGTADIASSSRGIVVMVLVLKLWKPKIIMRSRATRR